MERVHVQGFCSRLPGLKSIYVFPLIAVSVCVVVCSLHAGYVHSPVSPIVLNAAVTEIDTTTRAASTQATRPKSQDPSLESGAWVLPKDHARAKGQWQSVRMRVTAYCPCRICCRRYSDGITACGRKIQQGDFFVAADRRYPFGTEMIVPGYNNSEPVRVLDRGGVIRGNRLDVFFHSHQEALEWGVKYFQVKVRKSQ